MIAKLGNKKATRILLKRVTDLKLNPKWSNSRKRMYKHYLRWIVYKLEKSPCGNEIILRKGD